MGEFLAVPLFLPALAGAAIVGHAMAGRIALGLRISTIHAFALVMSVGVIVAATLTPQWAAVAHGATGPSSCDLSRLGFAPLSEYLRPGETSGNVLMFLPVGLTLSTMPWVRETRVLILAAVIFPIAIETTQLMLSFLDRGCQSADVVDNLAGLGLGLLLGVLGRAVVRLARRARA